MRLSLGGRRMAAAAILAAVALATVAIAPAAAIRYGDYDGNAHPWVGLMVAQDEAGNPLWRCTGTLLSSTVFLTAGHCVESPAAHVEVWFYGGTTHLPLADGYPAAGPNRCAGITGYPCTGDAGGTPVQNPNWNPNAFFLHDDGLVIFDAPYSGTSTYGLLPNEEQLDALHSGRATWFTAVGYGLQKAFPDAAAWKDEALRVRMVAYPWLYSINKPLGGIPAGTDLILSDNASSGGTCFGDSGGPNFIGDSRVIAGVNSFVLNSNCAGLSGAYRIDHAADLEWIGGSLK
jgi:hypothetical protein